MALQVSAAVLCGMMLCSAATDARAQTSPSRSSSGSASATPALAASGAAADRLNGYAEMLKATKPRASGGKNAALANRPYEPIRRIDDEGQIPEIEMFVGESRVFPTPGVARIAVGNGSLLTAAAIDNKEVILFANGPGTSSLFIWNADGRYQRVKISIVPGDTTRNAREIAAFLSSIPKAKASIVGANIIVEGDELSDVDLSKIDDLAKRYPQIVNFTNKVGWEQMILMDVKVVEFPISFLRDVGLKWNATGGGAIGAIWGPARYGGGGYTIAVQSGSTGVTAPIIPPEGATTVRIPSGLNVLSVLNLGLNAQLNLLEQEGKSTTLAEPQLSARNGSKASFTAGGEIPYAIATRDGLAVAFKEYGVKLDITPKVDRGGIIRAVIHAEVSSIDGSVSTSVGPALLLRKTDTEFNLRAGETMVLAGLLQRETSSTIDKVPLLGDIPVIGALFRSKRYQNKETEMVVFVTPTVVSANSPGNLDRLGRTTERLQERFGPAPYLSSPLQSGVSNERPNAIPQRLAPLSGDASQTPVMPATVVAMPLSAPVPVPATAHGPTSPVDARSTRGSNLRVLADSVLRTAPGFNAAPLLKLERGATVQLGTANEQVVSSGIWRNVVLGSLDGWVPAGAVSPLRADTTPPISDARYGASDRPMRRPLGSPQSPGSWKALTLGEAGPQAPVYKVAKSGLALRVTPDINAEVVSRPVVGALVFGLPTPTRGGWTAVQIGQGDAAPRGWISSQWLTPVTP